MYIKREALLRAVFHSLDNNPHTDAKVRLNHKTEHQHFARLIESQPAADVAPVVHGKWVQLSGEWKDVVTREPLTIHYCSRCGFHYRHAPYNYCPNCGARMDGGTHETD